MDLENNRLGRMVYLMYKPNDISAKVGEYIDNGWAYRLDESKQHIIETDSTGKQ